MVNSRFHLWNALFESIVKPAYEHYKDKMTQMSKERKDKTPYTKKINPYVPPGWCLHSTVAYGEVLDPVKMYRGENCLGKFVKHMEDEVKRLCARFPQ